MPTNRDAKTSSRSTGASSPSDKPNGSAARTGNGAAHDTPNGAANGGTSTHGVLGGIADVFRTAGNELRMENETLASYVDTAGDQMRRFADQIRKRGVADMLDDVSSFARRRPVVFIGGALLIGLGIARFLKSSSERIDDRDYGSGFSSVDPMTAGTDSPTLASTRR